MLRLVTFVSTKSSKAASVGLQASCGNILDLSSIKHDMPLDMLSLVESYHSKPAIRDILREQAHFIDRNEGKGCLIDAKFTRLLAPIPRPRRNVMCVGKNYSDHVAEIAKKNASKEDASKSVAAAQASAVKHATFFTKAPECVIGPDDSIPSHSQVTRYLDYEVELGVVIGKAGRDIRSAEAMSYVMGYTIGNDITARDLQKRHNQWFKGKSLDATCPVGPCIVPLDSLIANCNGSDSNVRDPSDLALRLYVNGELRQQSSTRNMIFDVPEIIRQLSEGFTLLPGDLILTGTPSGVGYAMQPPQCLKEGDEVVAEIEGIGRLRNTVGK